MTATKDAVTSSDPRGRPIDLHVNDLAGPSLQSWADLKKVRDALGLPTGPTLDLTDAAAAAGGAAMRRRYPADECVLSRAG